MAISPLSLLGAAASQFLGTDTLFKSTNVRTLTSSSISIVAPCVISEKHQDNYVITEHPTEMGVLITDHMYALPKTVDIEIAYSLACGFNAAKAVGALVGLGMTPKSINAYYDMFLKLQSDRVPFEITTGKRRYSNMLIESISNSTDSNSENMLVLNLHCKQILIVNTKYTTDSKYQSNAANTAAPSNNGTQQLKAIQ